MNRRLLGSLPARATFVLATAMAVNACGGNTEGTADLFPTRGGETLAQLGGGQPAPLYFNQSNRLLVDSDHMLGAIDLRAGAAVQLEVATADSTPLRYEVRRVRKDGTTEMVAPVDAQSGFSLLDFEATSDDTYLVRVTLPIQGTVVVFMQCGAGEGRCAQKGQPSEACAPWFPCASGLACVLPPGHCDPWTTFGTCGHPQGESACTGDVR